MSNIIRSRDYYNPFGFPVPEAFHEVIHFGEIHAPPPHLQVSHDLVAPFANANSGLEWTETPEAHVFKADIPTGFRKEEVKVDLEDHNMLRISGEKMAEKEEKRENWHFVERTGGRFVKCFRLPENVKAEKVKVNMEKGVLTFTIPKNEVKHNKRSKNIPIF